jgi:hypothetical protein
MHEFFTQALPYIVSVVGFSALILVPRHQTGWFVGIISQVFYIPFVLMTHEWGFLVHAGLYGGAFIRNFIFDERHPRNAAKIAADPSKKRKASLA